jgi:hypothetical protein
MVTMCCRKEVVKISLPGAEAVLVKLPRAKKGEERNRKEIEWRKKDTLGSIVVERNAREERGSERWAWWWTKTKA